MNSTCLWQDIIYQRFKRFDSANIVQKLSDIDIYDAKKVATPLFLINSSL